MDNWDATYALGGTLMNRLKAKGKRNGVNIEIKVIEGNTFVDGDLDDTFDFKLHEQHLMAGTYLAEPKSMLNIFNNLQHHFFDGPVEVEINGELEEIPYEDNRIY